MEDTQTTQQGLLLMMGVILLTLLPPAAGELQIRRMDSPIRVLMGDNAAIPCHFYGYMASPLDLSTVTVHWTRTSGGGNAPVYWFDGIKHIQSRPGSHIPDSGLMGGDGSLYIPNLQPSDDGEYTCTVIVTPERAVRKVTVWVSAKPTCTVSDPRLEMTPDTERSVTCYVSGFYPEPVIIHWEKYRKALSSKAESDIRTYISLPVQNPDGTYNMTSLLPIRPMSTDEDGDVYSCVIHHRSLIDPVTCNVTLSVHPVPDDRSCLIAGIVVCAILILLVLSVIMVIIYRHYIRKGRKGKSINGSDTVSQYSKTELLSHNKVKYEDGNRDKNNREKILFDQYYIKVSAAPSDNA